MLLKPPGQHGIYLECGRASTKLAKLCQLPIILPNKIRFWSRLAIMRSEKVT